MQWKSSSSRSGSSDGGGGGGGGRQDRVEANPAVVTVCLYTHTTPPIYAYNNGTYQFTYTDSHSLVALK